MTAFLLSLARVGAIALVASAAGWWIAAAFFPGRAEFRLERVGWSYALGFALIAAFVPLSFLAHVRPGWIAFLVLSVGLLAFTRLVPPLTLPAGRSLREARPAVAAGAEAVRGETPRTPPPGGGRVDTSVPLRFLLSLLIALGVALYAIQALTEPMWSNDFLAIWGLKGKSIFGSGAMPSLLAESPDLRFSHPEYPLGLPFLFAGTAFLAGRWDDHAMALLFPLFQLSTLCVLTGWLRRHGVSRWTSLLAAAILANFVPLYSGFLTGLAEVPLSFGLLLFGTALADAMGGEEPGALRRLAFAAALIAAIKNEGLFFAAAGSALGWASGGGRRWRIAMAALPTALVVHGLHLAWRGRLPLRDFDFSLFSPARLAEALTAAARVMGASAWAGMGLLLALILLGSRVPEGDRLLALCACASAAYVLLPAFAVRGPEWMVQTTLLRITAALAPLAAAAVAARFAEGHEVRGSIGSA